MTATAGPPDRQDQQQPRRSPVRVGLAAGLATAAIVVLWGGYGANWSWTGINGHTATLWDWLNLLLLPIAVGILPIWVARREGLRRQHKLFGVAVLSCFALLVIVGYVIPWAWTGFRGNTLWDWLNLLALPVAVALIPTFDELRAIWGPRHSTIALTALAVFVTIVVVGYTLPWAWTGFRGNTLWDWLHLLLLPLLLPTLIVPALMPMATAGLATDPQDADHAR
jgi:putative effector of murein hydrolase LrgA (UPF0299 family)